MNAIFSRLNFLQDSTVQTFSDKIGVVLNNYINLVRINEMPKLLAQPMESSKSPKWPSKLNMLVNLGLISFSDKQAIVVAIDLESNTNSSDPPHLPGSRPITFGFNGSYKGSES